jgi:hypothetical protein
VVHHDPLTTRSVRPSLGNDLTVDIYEDGTGWTGTSTNFDQVANLGRRGVGSRSTASANALTARRHLQRQHRA